MVARPLAKRQRVQMARTQPLPNQVFCDTCKNLLQYPLMTQYTFQQHPFFVGVSLGQAASAVHSWHV